MTDTLTAAAPVVEHQTGRDLRGLWRVLAALIITAAPLSIALGRAIMPYWTSDDSATMVANIVANQSTMSVLTWGGIILSPALLLSVLAIGFVARRGAPVLATLGAGLGFLAWCVGSATANMDYVVSQLSLDGFDQPTIVRIGESLQNSAFAIVCGVIWLLGHIFGMVLTGVALGRAKIVSWWVAGALMASQPIHFISAVVIPSRLLDVTLGWGLTTLASAVVSWKLLHLANDEWDLRPLPRR